MAFFSVRGANASAANSFPGAKTRQRQLVEAISGEVAAWREEAGRAAEAEELYRRLRHRSPSAAHDPAAVPRSIFERLLRR